MNEAIFLRLLFHENKSLMMAKAIESANHGHILESIAYHVNPVSFTLIPGSTFAYWTSEDIRFKFKALPQFESCGREIRIGDHPSDDFKFLRLFWEVPLDRNERSWFSYQKGGDYSPYYSDIHLLVDWDISRQTYRDFYGRPGRLNERPSNYQYFFRPGLTWSRRTIRGLSIRVLPAGCIFSDKGPTIFTSTDALSSLLGLANSSVFQGLVAIQMAAGSYEVGVLQRTPVPDLSGPEGIELGVLALKCVDIKRDLDQVNENSHAFYLPALLHCKGSSIAVQAAMYREKFINLQKQLSEYQKKIDEIAFQLYSISDEDRQAIEESLTNAKSMKIEDKGNEESVGFDDVSINTADFVSSLLSYTIGCIFGRWDIRLATGDLATPELPDPFAPLPIYSPGMLTDEEGLSLQETPLGYPLTIYWNGILVDDSEHLEDIISCVRDVLSVIWQDRADVIELEICQYLGIKDLRDYFRKSGNGGFWTDHIQCYSKSRRKAPIYWLLQSSKKNYSVWLYYHRLNKDTLFRVLNTVVEPKLRLEEAQLEQLRMQLVNVGTAGREAKQLERQLERQENFISELEDFRDKLRRAADLNLEPDLNDGVVLNIAPLWELVPWNEAKRYWQELRAGKYEWSSIGKQLRGRGLA